NLSGGMRMLIIQALVGAVISQVPITVEVESEDGSSYFEFETSIMKPLNLDDVDRQILKIISRGPTTIAILSQHLDVSRPTVWRRLKRMKEDEVIEVTELGKGVIKAVPTAKSKTYFEILSRLFH
ncbi:MAG: Lrp/AsnC family transcriptional regulator, partial [Candidatus Caldarchaeum sp.]|nr:Lrp/AsnC family transcriptional regulator [Candidatus Caldarchaeum sp.]